MRGLASDAGRQLARAARPFFAGLAVAEELISHPWASITFSGARHLLTLQIEGEGAGAAADMFLDGLEEREFALRGHIVADIVVAGQERSPGGRAVRLAIEALTIESAECSAVTGG